MSTTDRTIHAVYTGFENLILSRDLGEPDFVVGGTLDEAKLATKDRWDELAEMFEAEHAIDPDWDTFDGMAYARSPLGYWMVIKPIILQTS